MHTRLQQTTGKIRCFIDMDNVTVDYVGFMQRHSMTAHQVNHTKDTFNAMSPMPGAIAAVMAVINYGYDAWLATKPPTRAPAAYAEKAAWINERMPFMDRRIIMTQDKGLLGSRDDYLLDDMPDQANCGSFPGRLLVFGEGYRWTEALSELKDNAKAQPQRYNQTALEQLSGEEIRVMREENAISMYSIKNARAFCESTDPLFIVGYAFANEKAVNVRGDRHAWNMAYARDYRARRIESGRYDVDGSMTQSAS